MSFTVQYSTVIAFLMSMLIRIYFQFELLCFMVLADRCQTKCVQLPSSV